MTAKVVEEEAIFIALLLLIMGVHIAPWERRKGAQLASLAKVGTLRQGASAQCGREALAGRQAGPGSLLTIDHHVVPQDTGCVEGSLPWALKPIPALQGGPHAPIHVKELSGVHPHREPIGRSRGGPQGRKGFSPFSRLSRAP